MTGRKWRLVGWMRWWALPLVLALCAGSLPILPSGNRDAEFYLGWRRLLAGVGLVYVAAVLFLRMLGACFRFLDQWAAGSSRGRGFDVIVPSPEHHYE